MSDAEFTEMYVRYLQAKRDSPHLDHSGHFDAVKEARVKTILEDNYDEELSRWEAVSIVNFSMQSIERDFNRRA